MPNHVTNILTITGPEELVAKIKSEISGTYDDGTPMHIDFNKIIPRPGTLNITSGSSTSNGIAIIKYRAGDPSDIEKIMGYNWATEFATPEELITYMLEKGTANLEEAQQALDNLRYYGHQDWYSWSTSNWGTKWNAYSQNSDEGSNEIAFETAWSTPYPVIEALSRKYPEAVISIRYADEDFGHNVGEYTFQAGDVVEETTPEGGSDEAFELAADIQGSPEWFTDRLYDIEAETADELETYEIDSIRYAYDKGVLGDFPKVVLEVMEQMAVEDENYEFAERIKNTIAVNEE
mgnify:FL=1|jgi:hypothetical protein